MSEIEDYTQPLILEAIKQAIDLDADNQTVIAVQLLTALVDEFPREAAAHGYLAWILSRVGRHREAIEHGRVGVQLSPKSERESLLFFRVLWSAEQREQAFDEMKRFVAIGHSDESSLMMKEWEQIEKQG